MNLKFTSYLPHSRLKSLTYFDGCGTSVGFGDVSYYYGCEMSLDVNRSNLTTFRHLLLIFNFYDVCSLNIRTHYVKKYRHLLLMSVASTAFLKTILPHIENLLEISYLYCCHLITRMI
jgi:hypothetical protein